MATDRSLPKGEFIFREGESADYAYVLKAGSVELLKMGLEGEVVLVNLDTKASEFQAVTHSYFMGKHHHEGFRYSELACNSQIFCFLGSRNLIFAIITGMKEIHTR